MYVYNIVSISLGEFVEFLFKEAKSFPFYGYCYICVTSMGTTYRLCVYRKYFRFSFNKTKFCRFFFFLNEFVLCSTECIHTSNLL